MKLDFYRREECPKCTRIEQALDDLILGHQVHVIHKGEDLPESLPEGTKLPALKDEEELVQGSEAILKHLEKLEAFKAEWDKFQSDACYCDE